MNARYDRRRRSAVPSTAALLALGLFAALAGPALAQPRIRAVGPEHDFGDLAPGSKVEHAFVIRNAGDAPLAILSAKST